MKVGFAIAVLLLCAAFVNEPPAPAAKGREYGAGVKAKTVLPLKRAVAQRMFNVPIAVSATVKEVCKKKGCWMILTDADVKVRVTFKDYGFFMPKDLAGYHVAVEGVLEESIITEADARHYAEDAGKSKKDIERIKGDQQELNLEATGVRVR